MSDSPAAPIRRAGLIGDVHGEADTLEAALSYLEGRGPFDALLCTGDIADGHGGTDVDRCCSLLREAAIPVVRGNHDRLLRDRGQLSAASRRYLQALPPVRRFETPRGRLLLCHGVGADDMAGIFPEDGDAEVAALLRGDGHLSGGQYAYVVSGHTHRFMARRLADGGPIWVNAGTIQWGYERGVVTADFGAGAFTFHALAEDGRTFAPAAEVTP